MINIIYPLKTPWAISEDMGFVIDQIKERVNIEANYEWCRTSIELQYPISQIIAEREKIGRDYMKYRNRIKWVDIFKYEMCLIKSR